MIKLHTITSFIKKFGKGKKSNNDIDAEQMAGALLRKGYTVKYDYKSKFVNIIIKIDHKNKIATIIY